MRFPRGREASGLAGRGWAAALLGFGVLAFAVYWPALDGPPLFDDYLYIFDNPYVEVLSRENIFALFNPFGYAKIHFLNYAPVHIFAHGVELWLFGRAVAPYHVVNVILHVVSAFLLVLLLRQSSVPTWGALFAGAFFLLHPANVEAVAWMSQLKSSGALALALGALITFERRPAVSATLFALSLLTKALAAFALPLMVARVWILSGPPSKRRAWFWVGVWAAVFALIAPFQWIAFAANGEPPMYEEPDLLSGGRAILGNGARFLVMAATSFGTSWVHDFRPVHSWRDPWFLASLPLGIALVLRVLVTLRGRKQEAAYWIGAAAAYLPISQAISLSTPMGDRYLYFVLPGLLGAVSLMLSERLAVWVIPLGAARPSAGRMAWVTGVGVLLGFALLSHQRAALWNDAELLTADAARRDPGGSAHHYILAREAARAGDAPRAVALLASVARVSLTRAEDFAIDPAFESIRDDPDFRALVGAISLHWVKHAREHGYDSERWLGTAAIHLARIGELDEAIELLEQAIRLDGPQRSRLILMLEKIRLARAEAARRSGATQSNPRLDHRPNPGGGRAHSAPAGDPAPHPPPAGG